MTASRLSDLTVDDFDDVTDDLTVHGKRLARGTEPLQEAVDVGVSLLAAAAEARQQLTEAGEVVDATGWLDAEAERRPPHERAHLIAKLDVLSVELNEALTVLRALEALVTRCGGFMRMEDQQVLFAARELLKEHEAMMSPDHEYRFAGLVTK